MSDAKTDSLQQWQDFSPEQKAGAVAAGALTLAKPAIAAVATVRIIRSEQASWTNTALVAGGFVTDVDGKVARAFDAETHWGAVADPLADKASMAMVESGLAARRGTLARVLLGLRVTRDVAVSATRRYMLTNGNNGNGVRANGYGKASTTGRMTVAILGSSPIGERHPRLVDAADVASTALTLFSGGVTILRLVRSRRKAKH